MLHAKPFIDDSGAFTAMHFVIDVFNLNKVGDTDVQMNLPNPLFDLYFL